MNDVAEERPMMCRPILDSMLRAVHYCRNHDLDIAEWRMSAVSFAVLYRNVLRQDVRRSIYLRNEYAADDRPLILLGAPIIIDERVPCRSVEIVPRQYGRGSEYREMADGAGRGRRSGDNATT